MNKNGPVYGTPLIDTLPAGSGGMLQQMPSRDDLHWVLNSNLHANICPVTGIGMTLVEMLDDDGFSTERTRHTATLVGWGRSDCSGGIVAPTPLAAPSPTTEQESDDGQ